MAKIVDLGEAAAKLKLPPNTEQHFFTQKEWQEAADSFLEASQGMEAIIYANAEKAKPGSGKLAAATFSKHLVMAITAMSLVADNFADRIGVLIQKVPSGEPSHIIQ